MICWNCGTYVTDAVYENNARCLNCSSLFQVWTPEEGGEPRMARLGGYLPDAGTGGSRLKPIRAPGALPRKVDLRPGCTAVEDQGALGSCTANAAVGALEFHRKRVGLDPVELSRLFVYYNTRRLRGSVEADSGATISESMAAVLAYGAPDARLWPYDMERFKLQPDPEVYQAALFNEAVEFARVSPREGVWAAVAAKLPVCFGCFLPGSAYQRAALDGTMRPPSEQEWLSEEKGGHAMLIVGYDLDREIYIVRNSWGEGYGDKGYVYMPFSVMDRGAHAESFWVIGRLEQEKSFELERPQGDEVRTMLESAARTPSSVSEATASMREEIRAKLASGASGLRRETRQQAREDLRKSLRDRLTDKKR